MKAFIVFAGVVVALVAFTSAAVVPDDDTNEMNTYDIEWSILPKAVLDKAGDADARACTVAGCNNICRALGCRYGVCRAANWCHCYC